MLSHGMVPPSVELWGLLNPNNAVAIIDYWLVMSNRDVGSLSTLNGKRASKGLEARFA